MKIQNREIINNAVDLFGIDINSLRFLGGDDGDVYEARRENQAVILKLVPTTDQGLITLSEKIDFAHFLSANGVRLARWLPSVHDRLIEVIKVDEILVAATTLEKVPGRHPNMRDAAVWNAALFYQWGRIMGRMHQLARQYTGGDAIGHWHHEVAFFIDWCSDPEVKARWRDMEAYLRTLPRPQDAYGLIHNDLHQWNFMLNEGRIIIFDFDVCGHHWFSTDIAIALFHGLWVDSWRGTPDVRERTQKLYGSFMEGYAQENLLDEEWLGRLPYFLKYRQLLSFTVFSDPASAAHASRWQQRWVAKMRKGIVEDIPVLDLNF
jgi:Ser/Thr protein kinase RdoA (MazF antagonist)